MIDTKLNLARKLRCKNFDQIIGQILSVRMLKNSLYLGHYFPVYLFSGQRGCGKTTTARVFSAALNCKDLENFQKNPKKYTLPCIACDSCVAMQNGTHPDFIEMDAASHTGVDNVRQIIDAASLLPIMGVKKIYLIDEAHMLSKAAFNALLKILEEPPANVVFILATTDAQKIIDTVKSRCFQLLFKAVDEPYLLAHLQNVCVAENIPYESSGLSLIIHETRGSVRDALNIVEQVRFSAGSVTSQSVLRVLDHLDGGSFVRIIELIFTRNTHDMLVFLKQSNLSHFSAEYIWRRFIELMRTLLWLTYGVKPNEHEDYTQLERIIPLCTATRLQNILQHIYNNEEVFAKTTAQHLFLEMFFLQLCQCIDGQEGGSPLPPPQTLAKASLTRYSESEDDEQAIHDDQEDMARHSHVAMPMQQCETQAHQEETLTVKWHRFIQVEAIKKEPLLHSIFSQGTCVQFVADELTVAFAKELSFFESVVNDACAMWMPHFQHIFSSNALLAMNFTSEVKALDKTDTNNKKVYENNEAKTATRGQVAAPQQGAVKSLTSNSVEQKKNEQKKVEFKKDSFQQGYQREQRMRSVEMDRLDEQSNAIDISDSSVWKTTHMVLHHFPGLVREVQQ